MIRKSIQNIRLETTPVGFCRLLTEFKDIDPSSSRVRLWFIQSQCGEERFHNEGEEQFQLRLRTAGQIREDRGGQVFFREVEATVEDS